MYCVKERIVSTLFDVYIICYFIKCCKEQIAFISSMKLLQCTMLKAE